MASLDLQSVSRNFGATRAVDGVSFSVPSGAFLALLGPSGCGKTTLLRLLAGLERPDAGCIEIGGQAVAGPGGFVPPEARGLGMVFQSYALWPHMAVAGNIRFGLRLRGLSRTEEQARIREALALVGLAGLDHRRPHELSGGQRQRVALARSLATRPALLLLDEPLANLDAHLRGVMLAEFRRIHAALGTTFVFVTHDQDEAMAVASHVGVMNAGRLEQLATPETLYRQPATPMVARFVGAGRTVPVEVLGRHGPDCQVMVQGHVLTVPGAAPKGAGWLCLRPRDLVPAPGGPILVRVLDAQFRGGQWAVSALLDDGGAAQVDLTLPHAPHPGEALALRLTGGWVLPRDSVALAPAMAEGVPA